MAVFAIMGLVGLGNGNGVGWGDWGRGRERWF